MRVKTEVPGGLVLLLNGLRNRGCIFGFGQSKFTGPAYFYTCSGKLKVRGRTVARRMRARREDSMEPNVKITNCRFSIWFGCGSASDRPSSNKLPLNKLKSRGSLERSACTNF